MFHRRFIVVYLTEHRSVIDLLVWPHRCKFELFVNQGLLPSQEHIDDIDDSLMFHR